MEARAGGRVPVIAGGTFEGNVEAQASFVRDMAKVADIVVIICCALCDKDDSEEVRETLIHWIGLLMFTCLLTPFTGVA